MSEVSGWAYLTVALMVVDVGGAGANVFNMTNGTPSKPTANFSIGAGLVSYGLVGLVLLNEDDPELRNGFSLMMGAAGGVESPAASCRLLRRRQGKVLRAPARLPFLAVYTIR